MGIVSTLIVSDTETWKEEPDVSAHRCPHHLAVRTQLAGSESVPASELEREA